MPDMPAAENSEVLTRSLEQTLQEMREHRTDGIAELEQLLAEAPDRVELHGYLAWAYGWAGRHAEAVASYRKILDRSPDALEARWRMGDRLVNLGRLQEAEEAYRQVLASDHSCMDALMGVRYIQHLRRSERSADGSFDPAALGLSPVKEANQALNLQEFEQKRLTLRSLPPSLFLESTTKCNFYCKTCSKGYQVYAAEDLHTPVMEEVCRELMPSNLRISITGFGEPTLASNFDEIVKMSLEHSSSVHFVTNASLLSFGRLEQLTATPLEMLISFDGATKETFEEIRAGARFELILEKLAMIKKLRDLQLSGFRSKISLNFVALRKNIHELPDVVRIAHRYEIRNVCVTDYGFNGNEFDEQSLRFEPERANRFLDEAGEVARSLGVEFFPPPHYTPVPPPLPGVSWWRKALAARRLFPEPGRFPRRCNSPWSEPYIQTNGTVVPCCTNSDYLGSLRKQTFAQIWNGWRYRLLRLRIDSFFPPHRCRSCQYIFGINAGNAGNVMAKEGLLLKLMYALEYRLVRLAHLLESRWQAKRARTSPAAAEASGKGLYYKGRPLSARNRPAEVENPAG